ncbi:Low-density lipoprotein receptor- protein 12 [Biomphalaria glabrata]|nr:low-density lipoprotein receptor-related protein 12-like [Biomphalaria glabrata]
MDCKSTMWFTCLSFCLSVSLINSYCVHDDRIVTPEKGYLESPYYYSQSYPVDVCVKWTLHGKPGTKVTVKFLFLDIPENSSCDTFYIMIAFTTEQRYCGNSTFIISTFEANLTNFNTQVYVVFNSSAKGIRGKGFKMSYESTEGCSQQMYSNSGHISMTAHERLYLEDTLQSCYWTVLSPGGQSVIYRLFFETCSLMERDLLKVYDGNGLTASLIGSYNYIDCPNFLMTTTNSFYIQFIPGNRSSIGSISITFNAVTSSRWTTTLPSMPVYPLHSDYCHLNLSSSTGEITNNDDVYSAIKHCSFFYWKLRYVNPSGPYHYDISIETFELLHGDYVYFYDGPNESSNLLGAFMRGLPIPNHLYSSGNNVFIRYIPNLPTSSLRANFTFKFAIVYACPNGYLNCTGEAACYPVYKRCDGIWDCPIHGADEKGCRNNCGLGEFSCNSSSLFCYKESERCNGRGSCANYADEMGCTPEQCSSEKGLFLCNNGRCIYEKWHCDRTSDCTDNSDETDCSPLSSPRVIVAAVVGSLICVLLLVISLGCVCKLYNMRMNTMRRGTRHETPLSRQLAEMFHRRAPPPPYHEAMLTSRPYDEAFMELLAQEGQNGAPQFSNGVNEQDNATFAVPRERSHRGSRRCRHSRRHREVNQNPAGITSHEAHLNTSNIGGVDMFHVFDSDSTCFASLSQPPPYHETVSSLLHSHDTLDSSGESDDESILDNWQPDDTSQASQYADSQTEINQASLNGSPETTLTSVLRTFQHSVGTNIVQLQVDSDKDNDSNSTNISLDSTSGIGLGDNDGVKVECQNQDTLIDDDSDTECILAGNDDTTNINDDLTSDTVCLLSSF